MVILWPIEREANVDRCVGSSATSPVSPGDLRECHTLFRAGSAPNLNHSQGRSGAGHLLPLIARGHHELPCKPMASGKLWATHTGPALKVGCRHDGWDEWYLSP